MKNTNYWKSSPDAFSKLYDRPNDLSPSLIVSVFLNARTRVLNKLLRPDLSKSLLDIGCGSGVHLIQNIQKYKKVTGVDNSSGMLVIARKNLSPFPKNKWKLVKSDASHTSLNTGSYDTIIALGLLDYVASPEKVLKECRRLLKGNGEIIFSFPKNPSIFSPLRSSLGNIIKKHIFHLPPIDNSLDLYQLTNLLRMMRFKPLKITSVWSAMWMVKAKPI